MLSPTFSHFCVSKDLLMYSAALEFSHFAPISSSGHGHSLADPTEREKVTDFNLLYCLCKSKRVYIHDTTHSLPYTGIWNSWLYTLSRKYHDVTSGKHWKSNVKAGMTRTVKTVTLMFTAKKTILQRCTAVYMAMCYSEYNLQLVNVNIAVDVNMVNWKGIKTHDPH